MAAGAGPPPAAGASATAVGPTSISAAGPHLLVAPPPRPPAWLRRLGLVGPAAAASPRPPASGREAPLAGELPLLERGEKGEGKSERRERR